MCEGVECLSGCGQRVRVGGVSEWVECLSGQRVRVGGVSEWAECVRGWRVRVGGEFEWAKSEWEFE